LPLSTTANGLVLEPRLERNGTAPILIAGVAGQVGRELMSLERSKSGPFIGLSHAELDIREPGQAHDAIAAIVPRLVINAAAYTAVDDAERDRAAAFAVNCDGAANLARACAARHIPLIHISSDYVFDGRKADPYLETDPPAPLGVYGASKLAGEEAIRECLEEHVIVRASWLFSTHRTNFVKTILRLAAERSELRVVDDQRGGPTSAADLARSLLAIADAVRRDDKALWGTYHYCGGPAVTWCGFARAIIEESARHGRRTVPVFPIATGDRPSAAGRPANSMLNCAKIEAAFGIASSNWRAGLAKVVADLATDGRE